MRRIAGWMLGSLLVLGCQRESLAQPTASTATPSAAPTASPSPGASMMATPAKSYVANGWPIDVDLQPEKTTFLLGEPIVIAFRVRNRSAVDLATVQGGDTINPVGRHDRFKVTATDASGVTVVDPLAAQQGASGGNSFMVPEPIRHGGEWASRLVLQDWADLKAPGRYLVACTHDLVLARNSDDVLGGGKTSTVRVDLSITIDVQPTDAQALGRIIDSYGRTAVHGAPEGVDTPQRRALDALTRIDDPRVIPYLTSTAARGTYSEKYTALGALAKFTDDRALRALEAAEKSDPDPNIRAAAGYALDRSKHPLARRRSTKP